MSFSSKQQQQQQRKNPSQRSIRATVFLFLALANIAAVVHNNQPPILTFVAAFQPISIASSPVSYSSQVAGHRILSSSSSRFSSSRLYAAQDEETTPTPATPSTPVRRISPRPGEFELQELKINLASMRRQGVASRDLTPMKRMELQGYAAKITQSMDSPIALSTLDQVLPGTKWRLQFSTQLGAGTGPPGAAELPPDATITLTFHDDKKNVMDYALEFSAKTLGLNAIKATSQYTVGDRNGRNNVGLVTFAYDEIKTDAFGFKDIPTGFFGMLKGRVNYIQSVFMDDHIWIERGFFSSSSSNDNDNAYYNVYVRDDDETEP
jgi:hypothetical protein